MTACVSDTAAKGAQQWGLGPSAARYQGLDRSRPSLAASVGVGGQGRYRFGITSETKRSLRWTNCSALLPPAPDQGGANTQVSYLDGPKTQRFQATAPE